MKNSSDEPGFECIGKSIKVARENIGWSQSKLSKESGVDRAALNGLENGDPKRQNMTIDTIRRLARALCVSPGDIIDGKIKRSRISEKEIIDEIINEMERKRIRRPELAEKIGIPVWKLSAILDGTTKPEMNELRSICEKLGVSLNAPSRVAEIKISQELMGGALVAEGVIRLRPKS